jgi:hypothetical protein
MPVRSIVTALDRPTCAGTCDDGKGQTRLDTRRSTLRRAVRRRDRQPRRAPVALP